MKHVIAVLAMLAVCVVLAVNFPKTFILTAVIFSLFLYGINRK